MNESSENTAKRIFRTEWEHLSAHEREVIEGVLHRISIPRNPNKEFADRRTFGQRASDANRFESFPSERHRLFPAS